MLRSLTVSLALLAASLAGTAPVAAQDHTLKIGSIIRGTDHGSRVEGHLLDPPVAGQPLRIKYRGREVNLRWDDPTLALQTTKSKHGSGAGKGFLIGVVAGAIVGFASGDDQCGEGFCVFTLSASDKAFWGGLSFGTVGALIGSLVSPGARWTPIGPASPTRAVKFTLNDER